MTANVMVVVERQYDYPRPVVFRAWTAPEEMARWRGSPGWHVETETVTSDLRVGGRHHHVKVRDNDPTTRVTTDAVFTEYFEPDVFVDRRHARNHAALSRPRARGPVCSPPRSIPLHHCQRGTVLQADSLRSAPASARSAAVRIAAASLRATAGE